MSSKLSSGTRTGLPAVCEFAVQQACRRFGKPDCIDGRAYDRSDYESDIRERVWRAMQAQPRAPIDLYLLKIVWNTRRSLIRARCSRKNIPTVPMHSEHESVYDPVPRFEAREALERYLEESPESEVILAAEMGVIKAGPRGGKLRNHVCRAKAKARARKGR